MVKTPDERIINMSQNQTLMDRRTVLKALGGSALIGAGGLGASAIIGTGAAASVNISAGDVDLSTDHGEIDRVSVQPDLNVFWDGFDEVVGKVRILLETAPHDVQSEYVGQYVPVWRATGWLNGTGSFNNNGSIANRENGEAETGPGYHGELHVNGVWLGGPDGITLYDREGPSYPQLQNPESFWNGVSVGQDVPEGGFENGIYEQAGSVDRFFNSADGTVQPTAVNLRYTVSFHAPNASIASGYDIPEEDVSEQSPLVMANANDVSSPIGSYPPEAIPYNVLQDNAGGHPAVVVEEATFDVNVENQPSQQSGGGNSNSDGSATDNISEQAE